VASTSSAIALRQRAFVLDISPYWERKLAAICCYESQFITGRPIAPPTFVDQLRDQAAFWSWSIGKAFGEPFASREPIGVSGMEQFV
jgi:N-acetylglucosamine malate deacetylase 1